MKYKVCRGHLVLILKANMMAFYWGETEELSTFFFSYQCGTRVTL